LIIFGLIIILGAFLRLYQLELKPMHHDEANLQYFYVEPLLISQPVFWDYENHGFFYNYLAAPFVQIIGLSLYSLRFSAALFSILSIFLFYFFKKYIGSLGVLVSSAFFALSPLMVYYGRQYTNYPFFVFFFLIFLLILANFSFNKKANKLIQASLLALLSAILLNINFEAFVINCFIIIAFIFIYILFTDKKYLIVHQTLKKFGLINFLITLFIFLLVFICINTSFFTNFNNLASFLQSFTKISQKIIETGHNKSVFYYFKLFWPYELGLLILGFAGFFIHKKNLISKFIVFWTIFSLLIFSLIPYKTNWTAYVIILPLFFSAGIFINKIKDKVNKSIVVIGLIFSVFISLFFTWQQNFVVVNQPDENQIGYVETLTDVYALINKIAEFKAPKDDVNILITAKSSWPLAIYLKDYNLDYLTEIDQLDLNNYKEYDFIISEKAQVDQLDIDDNKNLYQYELRRYYYLVLIDNN
jgi:uncharacterized protein (TIGR03663 family)